MPFWSQRPKDAEVESSEQTLARLQSAAAESTDHLLAGADAPASSFRSKLGGYNIAEVDRFLASIDERTVDEIQTVLFRTSRHERGYNEDDVDQLLDAVSDQRASER